MTTKKIGLFADFFVRVHFVASCSKFRKKSPDLYMHVTLKAE